MQENGLILKGIGGFYTVLLPSGEELTAKARGKFRLDGISPVCGDRVAIERQQEGDAAMIEILPRRNLLRRPPVSNIDQLVIVLAVTAPKPDLLLCDKLLLAAAPYGIEPLIVFNKIDDAVDAADSAGGVGGAMGAQVEALAGEYGGCYHTLTVSAETGAGIGTLSDALAGKISCFAGQSAVGKSSLLNVLIPELELPVGGLAKRTDRGRHTTRHAQLWPYRGGAVLDTPGFSLLDLPLMEQADIDAAYREFGDAPSRCRFAACAHRSEPDCAVKALIGKELPEGRYERYVELSKQFEEMRKRQYD